jgi:hypothetical protein
MIFDVVVQSYIKIQQTDAKINSEEIIGLEFVVYANKYLI